MVSQPIRLILVDWFVFHFCLGRFPFFFGCLHFFFRSSSIFYFFLGRLPFNQAQMSPHTHFQSPRTSLSGRIQIGHKSGLSLFIYQLSQCEYKASQAWLWLQPRLGLAILIDFLNWDGKWINEGIGGILILQIT